MQGYQKRDWLAGILFRGGSVGFPRTNGCIWAPIGPYVTSGQSGRPPPPLDLWVHALVLAMP
jgi:hypothetical protein